MGRPLRPTAGDVVYHVLNRANARRTLFEGEGDYAACDGVTGNRAFCRSRKGYGAMILRKAAGVMM